MSNDYIKRQLAIGKKKEEVADQLEKTGWKKTDAVKAVENAVRDNLERHPILDLELPAVAFIGVILLLFAVNKFFSIFGKISTSFSYIVIGLLALVWWLLYRTGIQHDQKASKVLFGLLNSFFIGTGLTTITFLVFILVARIFDLLIVTPVFIILIGVFGAITTTVTEYYFSKYKEMHFQEPPRKVWRLIIVAVLLSCIFTGVFILGTYKGEQLLVKEYNRQTGNVVNLTPTHFDAVESALSKLQNTYWKERAKEHIEDEQRKFQRKDTPITVDFETFMTDAIFEKICTNMKGQIHTMYLLNTYSETLGKYEIFRSLSEKPSPNIDDYLDFLYTENDQKNMAITEFNVEGATFGLRLKPVETLTTCLEELKKTPQNVRKEIFPRQPDFNDPEQAEFASFALWLADQE